MFFCERNVSLPQSNVKEMACFRTPMTLKCQGGRLQVMQVVLCCVLTLIDRRHGHKAETNAQ